MAKLRGTIVEAYFDLAPSDPPSPVVTISHHPLFFDLDLYIAFWKCNHSFTAHFLSYFVSYGKLVPYCLHSPVCSLTWQQAIDEKMQALVSRQIWVLVRAPQCTLAVGCHWIYTVKFSLDSSMHRFKVCLITKGFSQTYGIDYLEIFSSMVHLNFICILLSLAINLGWLMFYLDVKNASFYGDIMRTFVWRNLQDILIKGRISFENLRKSFMYLNKVLEPNLKSPQQFLLVPASSLQL